MSEETEAKVLLEKYLRDSHVFNLATAVNGQPSNRDMFYIVPENFTDTIYATTPHDAPKLGEILLNPNVSITTVPTDEDHGVVTSNTAQAKISELKIDDVLDLLADQIPQWSATVGDGKDEFVVIEIKMPTVKIFGTQGISSIKL
ncbi:MAG: pyridoxamine 5'-phosphate oxidase family protein [Lactobacillaceae bacterium]|jgi:general stress protein 26|nr:pyridoxamine 5'-phosphate oxidase family protein [Lactobacillaceae bacterium]